MSLLDDIKKALRINNAVHDTEVSDLIDAAKLDLQLSGLDPSIIVDTDPLIKRSIALYVKGHFGYDNPEAPRFIQAYDALKIHLALSGDYDVA